MRNTLIFLVLVAVLALTPFIIRHNNRTAIVRGYLPTEMGSMESHWVYLQTEGLRLDSTTIAEGYFELQAKVRKRQVEVLLSIPDCGLEQPLMLRPGKEIELHISLDEYYRQRAAMEMIEARARLDENGLSLPDSVWSVLRDELIERYLQNSRRE